MSEKFVRLLQGNGASVGKLALLIGLLFIHCQARRHVARTMPGKNADFYCAASNYFQGYRVSLSLLAGQGFRRLALPGEAGDPATDTQILRGTHRSSGYLAPMPEAQPIIDFLTSRRPQVSQNEFDKYLAASGSATQPCDAWETARILDIYVTAGLWKVFGISWSVYYAFSSVLSTAACFLIFLIARRLSGSYWAGLLAAILSCASPLETHFAIRSLRDISPLWFATLAFAFFVCCLDQFRSRYLNHLTFLAMGILTMLGRGWRVDVLLLVPFFLAGIVVVLLVQHRGWKYAVVGCSLFLGGALGTDRVIRLLCPGEREGAENGFHVAYYGDFSRCNLLGLENSFQISRDDVQTFYNACFYNETKHPDKPLRYVSGEYGRACQGLLRECLKYHAYQYLKLWPKFYMSAMSAFPDPGMLQGEDISLLKASRLPWLQPWYEWVLDGLTRSLPYWHLLGIVTLYWIGQDKVRGTLLVVFGVYYSWILFLVLPEHKHLGELLLPLTVTGGLGLWGLMRLARSFLFPFSWRELQVRIPPSLRAAAWTALAAGGCWLLACLLTYPYSVRQRTRFLNGIRTLAARAPEANENLRGPGLFSVCIRGEEQPVGYLLTIQSLANPGYLTCRHVRFPREEIPGRILVTHHKLHESRLQYFAVSCFHAAKYGDRRSYVCTVILPPGARIVDCRKLNLSGWKRLPFSTVFCDDEPSAGSPIVGRIPYTDLPIDPHFGKYYFNNLSSEVAYAYPWEMLTDTGLPLDQNSGLSSQSRGEYSR